jgi:hypothetical protein
LSTENEEQGWYEMLKALFPGVERMSRGELEQFADYLFEHPEAVEEAYARQERLQKSREESATLIGDTALLGSARLVYDVADAGLPNAHPAREVDD